MEIQHLLNRSRKKTIECVIPSGSDPLPDEETLLSLHQVCPNASFFSLIPPVSEESEPVTVPKTTQVCFPRTLPSFHSEEYKDASTQELEEKLLRTVHSVSAFRVYRATNKGNRRNTTLLLQLRWDTGLQLRLYGTARVTEFTLESFSSSFGL